MPKLGLTMTEGLVAEWMVPLGSPFKAEQGLFVVETDKVATEIAAEGGGVLTEIIVPAGQTVSVGEVLAYWQDESEGVAPAAAAAPPAAANMAPAPDAPAAAAPAPAQLPAESARVPVTPLARRMSPQMGVDLATVSGSGPRGRIKAADVQAAAARPAVLPPAPVAAAAPAAGMSRSRPDAVQAAMARRLTAVKQQVPHFYLALEADVSRLVDLRAELNALQGPVRFTLNHFIVAAVGRVLRDQPQANRVWDDGEILSFSASDVGMAVSTERGLFVPMVRDAGAISLTEVARRAQAQAERAKGGALNAGDMSGGAITVSNAGMFNVKFMTPIINPGHSMILGVGSVDRVFRPDGEGRPMLRQEMGLVLAADHRLMDGVAGLRFLNQVASYLEQPMKLLVNA
jgi:pyruvate dehydrogenase E2 component (dihydrolipoamide acetyltransferase)